MKRFLHRLAEEIWYGKHPARLILLPFSWVFLAVVRLRRMMFTTGLFGIFRAPVPVIVVGNLTVGGSGKTPLVIWLAQRLQAWGFKPAIVARGYGGRARSWPQQVRPDSDPVVVGDEAIVLARRTQAAVAVGPRRSDDIEQLLLHSDANIVICDDGLQHYGLGRDIEIALLDGVRRLGNGLCLPAGPLREPESRLEEVDLIVTQGLAGRQEFAMQYQIREARRVKRPEEVCSLTEFRAPRVHAVTAIGHAEKFFRMLRQAGLTLDEQAYPDHFFFSRQHFVFEDNYPILMTEKDAVKCEAFADDRFWFAPLEVELPEVFDRRLKILLKKVIHGQETA